MERRWLLRLPVTLLHAIPQREPTGPREAGDRRGTPSPPPPHLVQPLSAEGLVGRKQMDSWGESRGAWEPSTEQRQGPWGLGSQVWALGQLG